MARTMTNGGMDKRTVSRLAWREAKTTEDAHKRLGVERRASAEPWGGFVAVDLGFGLLQGPNILATMQDLDTINRRNREALNGPKRRRPKRSDRVTGKRARRAIHQMLRLRRAS